MPVRAQPHALILINVAHCVKGVMNLPQQQAPDGVIPDLRDIPLNQLAKLGDSVLAHSLVEYLLRFEDGVKYNRFNNYMPSTISPGLRQVSVDQNSPAPC